jgi:dihydrofolate reductase
MRKLTVFNFVTLNGFFKGPQGDLGWHKHGGGEDEKEYASEGVGRESVLLFGRVTYEMMSGYWPTHEALKNDRKVAEGMNKAEKIVFSNTLKKADWNNTIIIKDNIVEAIKKMKQSSGKDMTILGSGSIVTQFAEKGLIDAYEIMVDPVAIGGGTPLLNDLKHPVNLKLTNTRSFKSGVVVLSYQRM